jgi:hypothetical protein
VVVVLPTEEAEAGAEEDAAVLFFKTKKIESNPTNKISISLSLSLSLSKLTLFSVSPS